MTYNLWKSKSTVFLLLLAFLLIIACACGDLWFDEIWSLTIAASATSPLDILTVYRHDNNHILNTLFLYLIGPQKHFYFYRLLSIASGFGSLIIMALLTKERGKFATVCMLLLGGTSYPLVLYFSEARGYAPAIFFSLLAYWIHDRYRSRLTPAYAALFWIALIAGFLAHFTFIIFIIAIFTLSCIHEKNSDHTPLQRVRRVCLLYALPALALMIMYYFYLRQMAIGGGDDYRTLDIITYAALLLHGLPDGGFSRFFSLLCYAGAVFGGVFMLKCKHRDEWLFYLMILVIAPALMLIVTKPPVLYFRYFILCFPFYYLLLAKILGECYRANSVQLTITACAIIGLIMTGQSRRLMQLATVGRGGYSKAITYIAGNTAGSTLNIGSDHDFRNRMLLIFYSRFLSGNKTLNYINQDSWQLTPPEWVLSHSQDHLPRPIPELAVNGVGAYKLEQQFPSTVDSGWHWFLYHRSR